MTAKDPGYPEASGRTARVRISLGTQALPAVAEAIRHAVDNPGHNPVVDATVEGAPPVARSLSWVCVHNDAVCAGSVPE